MQKVTVNGVAYIGDLDEKDGKALLTNAFEIGEGIITRGTFANYLKAKNLGDLQPLTFSGMGTSVAVGEFTDSEKMELEMATLAMKHAKAIAIPELENETFEEVLEK